MTSASSGPRAYGADGVGGVERRERHLARPLGLREDVGRHPDPRRQRRAPARRLLDGAAAQIGGDALDAGGDGVVVPRRGGSDRLDGLDGERDDLVRVGGGRLRLLEVVARDQRGGVVGECEPVAVARRAAERDLVAAVGRDVDLGVVDHARGARRVLALDRTGLDGERRVHGTGEVAGHAVLVLRIHRGLEVDGVGVVAQRLAGRADDAPPGRTVGVELELHGHRALDEVHEQPVPVGVVARLGDAPLRAQVTRVDLGQRVEELTEGGSARGLGHRGTSRSGGCGRSGHLAGRARSHPVTPARRAAPGPRSARSRRRGGPR